MSFKYLVFAVLLPVVLTGCSVFEKKMPEEVKERLANTPRVNVKELSEKDKIIFESKKKALIKALDNWGFDPVFIANYHIDLGCNYFFEKTMPYKKVDRVKHNEFFVLRDYNRQLEDKHATNSDFCDPLRLKLIYSSKKSGSFSQKMYVVSFTPSGENDWIVDFKPGRFMPAHNCVQIVEINTKA